MLERDAFGITFSAWSTMSSEWKTARSQVEEHNLMLLLVERGRPIRLGRQLASADSTRWLHL